MTATVTLDEVWRLFKENAEQFKETREQLREASARMEENDRASIRRHAETEAALRQLSRQMGHFSNQVGEFAEEMVVPAAKRLFAARGIPVHTVARNVQGERDGLATEVDIVVVNTEYVVAIEVKARPRVNHVDEHLERLAIFKKIFPEYGERKLLGAIAGIIYDPNVARYTYQRGLFVLRQSGDMVTILNAGRFQPKIW